jgi:hypothetical protein
LLTQVFLEIRHRFEPIDLIPIDPTQNLIGAVGCFTGVAQPSGQRGAIQVFDIFFYGGPLYKPLFCLHFLLNYVTGLVVPSDVHPPNPPDQDLKESNSRKGRNVAVAAHPFVLDIALSKF